jgi:hypothetical protein
MMAAARRESFSDRDPEEVGPDPAAYEPPGVERVLTPAELEREILYAGSPQSQDGTSA